MDAGGKTRAWRLGRMQVAVGALATGILLLATFFVALPRIQGFESRCEPEDAARAAAGGGWFAVRTPQLGEGVVGYDAANRTTLIVPGCGHGNAGVAVRVAGDHRDFARHDRPGERGMKRLVLVAQDVNGTLGATLPAAGGSSADRDLRVLEGMFTAASMLPHLLAFTLGAALTPAGLGLLRRGVHWGWGLAPAVGALAGWGTVYFLLSSGSLFVMFLVGIPFLLLPAVLVGGVGSLASWRNPRRALVFAGLLAFAAAAILGGIGFLEAFPADPEA